MATILDVTSRCWLALSVLGGGVAVPVAVTLLVPLVVPERSVGPPGQVLLVAWTIWPFVLLGLVGRMLMKRPLAPAHRSRHTIALACALVAGAAVEAVVYLPQASHGMNFGLAFFPGYAAVVMPVGWALGWIVARLAVRGPTSSP